MYGVTKSWAWLSTHLWRNIPHSLEKETPATFAQRNFRIPKCMSSFPYWMLIFIEVFSYPWIPGGNITQMLWLKKSYIQTSYRYYSEYQSIFECPSGILSSEPDVLNEWDFCIVCLRHREWAKYMVTKRWTVVIIRIFTDISSSPPARHTVNVLLLYPLRSGVAMR